MHKPLSQRDRFRLHLPYSSRKTPDAQNVIIWRWKMLSFISILLLFSVFYFFLFSSYFRFTSVESTQTLFIPDKEVVSAIDSFILKKRYHILPQNNYFLLRKKNLSKMLEENFKLTKVTILKDAPNSLFIYFKEQISVFIASLPDAKDEIQLFDHMGENVQTLRREDYNSRLPFITVQSYSNVNENLAEIVLLSWEITNLRNSNYKIIAYFEQGNQLLAITDRNFEIRFSLTSDADLQLGNLNVLQQSFLKGEPLPNEYIDLRFSEKVFLK